MQRARYDACGLLSRYHARYRRFAGLRGWARAARREERAVGRATKRQIKEAVEAAVNDAVLEETDKALAKARDYRRQCTTAARRSSRQPVHAEGADLFIVSVSTCLGQHACSLTLSYVFLACPN